MVLTHLGKPVAIVVGHAVFRRLVDAAAEASERAALAQARDGDDCILREQVNADLGLL